jgi:uncharacterized protein YjbI with pentapeptide repeats
MRHFWCKDIPVVDYKDEEGNEYCVFHAPRGKKGISVKEFNTLIFKKISEATEGKICNLSGTVFEGDITFGGLHEKILPSIDFTSAVFSGKTAFSRVTFREEAKFPYAKFIEESDFFGVRFFGNTNFAIAEFSEMANFTSTEFREEANFLKTKFIGKAYFLGANFIGGASFSQTAFSEGANFSAVKFSKEADFSGVTFNLGADFNDAKFSEKSDFKRVSFGTWANFSLSEFGGEANFSGTTFRGKGHFFGTKFKGAAYFFKATFSGNTDFSGATFIWVNFSEATFNGDGNFFVKTLLNVGDFTKLYLKERVKVKFERVYLNNVSFIDTDLRRIDFINCIWPKKLTLGIKPSRDVLYDELALFSNIKDNDEEGKNFFQKVKSRFKGNLFEILKREMSGFKKDIFCDKGKITKVEILYRRLKQKYKEEHNEPEVSNWHYSEKEMYRKVKRLRRMIPFTLSNLYWFSSGYGERPIRAGVVLFLIILTISILSGLAGLSPFNKTPPYEIAEIKGGADIMDIQNLWALILNTLQYATFEKEPDFIPKTIYGASLKLAAKILIPLQTALFALAVRNRFRR